MTEGELTTAHDATTAEKKKFEGLHKALYQQSLKTQTEYQRLLAENRRLSSAFQQLQAQNSRLEQELTTLLKEIKLYCVELHFERTDSIASRSATTNVVVISSAQDIQCNITVTQNDVSTRRLSISLPFLSPTSRLTYRPEWNEARLSESLLHLASQQPISEEAVRYTRFEAFHNIAYQTLTPSIRKKVHEVLLPHDYQTPIIYMTLNDGKYSLVCDDKQYCFDDEAIKPAPGITTSAQLQIDLIAKTLVKTTAQIMRDVMDENPSWDRDITPGERKTRVENIFWKVAYAVDHCPPKNWHGITRQEKMEWLPSATARAILSGTMVRRLPPTPPPLPAPFPGNTPQQRPPFSVALTGLAVSAVEPPSPPNSPRPPSWDALPTMASMGITDGTFSQIDQGTSP